MSDSGFVWRVRRKIDEMSQKAAAERDPAERRRLKAVAAILVEQLERIAAGSRDSGKG
jgi:Family of unknown function (DUF6381)